MSKIGNYVVGAEEDGTIIFDEQENCYKELTEEEFEKLIMKADHMRDELKEGDI